MPGSQEPEPSSSFLEFLVGFPRRTRGEMFPAPCLLHVSSMPGCGHLVKPGEAFVESVFGSSGHLLYLGIMLRLASPPSLKECVCVVASGKDSAEKQSLGTSRTTCQKQKWVPQDEGMDRYPFLFLWFWDGAQAFAYTRDKCFTTDLHSSSVYFVNSYFSNISN